MVWFLIALAVLLAAASLYGDRARARYVEARVPAPPLGREPLASVIVPVKGFDEGLAANLLSLAALEYGNYELVVTARSAEDVPPGVMPPGARLVIAGDPPPDGTGEKVQNLLAAVAAARAESDVFAFADSDGRVRADWLRALVGALDEPDAGAATGYRWHAPERATPAALLRSAWNAVVAGGFGPGDNRFAWGGAMAIRRRTFVEARVAAYWQGAISDDYRLSDAVHAAGLRIVYAPAALVAAVDGTGIAEFLGWIRRQMMITRFYSPRLWWLAIAGHVVYCGAMAGAAVLTVAGSGLAAVALALIFAAGWLKAYNRTRLALLALPAYAAVLRRDGWVHTWLSPVTTWIWLYGLAASAIGDSVKWRGRRYQLRRPCLERVN